MNPLGRSEYPPLSLNRSGCRLMSFRFPLRGRLNAVAGVCGPHHSGNRTAVDRRPDLVRVPGTSEPRGDESEARRKRHVLFAGLGALAGVVIGLAIVFIISRPRFGGSAMDTAVLFFGIPPLLLVGGAVIGFLIGAAPEAEDVDAPVRDMAQMDGGNAAVSTQGQLPGSPVEPVVAAPDASPDPSRLPSQRNPDDPDAGLEPGTTSRPV
jgi:hypothetical protein